jgi:hypothetical protein
VPRTNYSLNAALKRISNEPKNIYIGSETKELPPKQSVGQFSFVSGLIVICSHYSSAICAALECGSICGDFAHFKQVQERANQIRIKGDTYDQNSYKTISLSCLI